MSQLGPSTSALDLAAALRARELSAAELLEACLAAVDERNPELNAVVWRDDEAARAAARDADARLAAGEEAPFLGVPIPIKDLTAVAGWPVTYGSNAAPEGPSEESELIVESLLDAGFVLCGRTNTPEFGPITVAENDRYGNSLNPWDTSRSPGGSSGGAGAAVAGGMFPIAHANDGGGSIRIPSAYCGLVGLKSSRARVPRRAQSWMGAVVEGVITRTVADAAAVLDVTAGPDPLAWNNAIPPQRPFAEELAAAPGRLRIGLMAEAPLGIPTAPDCVELDPRLAVARDQVECRSAPVEPGTSAVRPSGDPRGHADRGRRRRGPVVRRHADGVELDELPEHARVLEERLELPVVGVGLAVVGGDELAAVRDLVADGRHVVLPAARRRGS